MPTVYNPNAKYIKDLGWLQRHAALVQSVDVRAFTLPSINQGYMTATLTDGRVYTCIWASLKVCAGWLSRKPSLTNVECFWVNHTTTCGALKHYRFGGE